MALLIFLTRRLVKSYLRLAHCFPSLLKGDDTMSASPVQLSSYWKSDPGFSILIVLLVIGVSIWWVASVPRKQALADKLTSQLREEKFAELYDEADDMLRRNVTKDKFIQRMKVAVGKLKAIDENLDFKRDFEAEKGFSDGPLLILVLQKLGTGNKSVLVMSHWNTNGEFFDLAVLPETGTSDEFSVPGVLYQHRYRGNQLVD
jgi:hypothetical protein